MGRLIDGDKLLAALKERVCVFNPFEKEQYANRILWDIMDRMRIGQFDADAPSGRDREYREALEKANIFIHRHLDDGNECEHGFSPPSRCTNKKCEDREDQEIAKLVHETLVSSVERGGDAPSGGREGGVLSELFKELEDAYKKLSDGVEVDEIDGGDALQAELFADTHIALYNLGKGIKALSAPSDGERDFTPEEAWREAKSRNPLAIVKYDPTRSKPYWFGIDTINTLEHFGSGQSFRAAFKAADAANRTEKGDAAHTEREGRG